MSGEIAASFSRRHSFGNGGDDTFVFRAGFGKDTIADLLEGDTLDLRGLGITSLEDLFANAAGDQYYIDGAANAVIHLGKNDITLTGVTPRSSQASRYWCSPRFPSILLAASWGVIMKRLLITALAAAAIVCSADAANAKKPANFLDKKCDPGMTWQTCYDNCLRRAGGYYRTQGKRCSNMCVRWGCK